MRRADIATLAVAALVGVSAPAGWFIGWLTDSTLHEPDAYAQAGPRIPEPMRGRTCVIKFYLTPDDRPGKTMRCEPSSDGKSHFYEQWLKTEGGPAWGTSEDIFENRE